MIKITNKIIESFNPCQDGIYNFNKKYPNYNDRLSNLLRLEDISYNDKIWLCTKTVPINILQQWAVECTEKVVDNYNNVYPNDTRLTKCLETTKLYLEGKCDIKELILVKSLALLACSEAKSEAKSGAMSVSLAAEPSGESVAASVAWSTWSEVELEERSVWSEVWSEADNLNLSILIALLENRGENNESI